MDQVNENAARRRRAEEAAKPKDDTQKDGNETENNKDNSGKEEQANIKQDDKKTNAVAKLKEKAKKKITRRLLISILGGGCLSPVIFIVLMVTAVAISLGIIKSDISTPSGSSSSGGITTGGTTYLECRGVEVEGDGVHELEEYIAGVVNCEISGIIDESTYEAIKANAIAARTYLIYTTNGCSRAIGNSQSAQVYSGDYCPPSNKSEFAIRAANDTAGMVLTYNNEMFMSEYDSFYKGGNYQCNSSECSNTYTLQPAGGTHTVYADAKDQAGFMGGHGHGMSQYGAKYLASQGKTYEEILGFFYSPGVQIANLTAEVTNNGNNNTNLTSLNNVVFLGDSILGGYLKSKIEADGAKIFYQAGATTSFFLGDGTKTKIGLPGNCGEKFDIDEDLAGITNPPAFYIILGQNGAYESSAASEANDIKKLVEELKNKYPNVPIYINSVIPMGPGYYRDGSANSETYNRGALQINSSLKDYAASTDNVYYSDVLDGYKENVDKYTSWDSMHLHPSDEGATVLYENIKKNIISTGGSNDGGEENDNGTYPSTFTTTSGVTYNNYKQYLENNSDLQHWGCSITSCATIISGRYPEVTPSSIYNDIWKKVGHVYMGGYFQAYNMSYTSAEEDGIERTKEELINKLKSGGTAILRLRNPQGNGYGHCNNGGACYINGTQWTTCQHYIAVLAYRESDNSIYISDPGSGNDNRNGWFNIDEFISDSNTGCNILIDYLID